MSCIPVWILSPTANPQPGLVWSNMFRLLSASCASTIAEPFHTLPSCIQFNIQHIHIHITAVQCVITAACLIRKARACTTQTHLKYKQHKFAYQLCALLCSVRFVHDEIYVICYRVRLSGLSAAVPNISRPFGQKRETRRRQTKSAEADILSAICEKSGMKTLNVRVRSCWRKLFEYIRFISINAFDLAHQLFRCPYTFYVLYGWTKSS